MWITFYPRSGDRWETENFSAWEFLCPDCKREYMDVRLYGFIWRLQRARTIAGIPFVLGSGWRCYHRNAAVGGVDNSDHKTGHAGDIIVTTSEERFIVFNAVIEAGFTRVGVAKFFIHVDDSQTKPQDVIWVY